MTEKQVNVGTISFVVLVKRPWHLIQKCLQNEINQPAHSQGFGEQGKNNSCRGTSQILKTGEH